MVKSGFTALGLTSRRTLLYVRCFRVTLFAVPDGGTYFGRCSSTVPKYTLPAFFKVALMTHFSDGLSGFVGLRR
jgi:hypothetical protein